MLLYTTVKTGCTWNQTFCTQKLSKWWHTSHDSWTHWRKSLSLLSAKEYYYARRIRIWGYWHEVCLHNAFDWIQTVCSISVWSKSSVFKKEFYNQQRSVLGQHNKCTLASLNSYWTSVWMNTGRVNKHDVNCNETQKEEIPCRALYWNLLPE